jgi:hypothetical protein
MAKVTYNPNDILGFQPVPEMDWLKDHLVALKSSNDPIANKLELLYKYIIWSRRYALGSDERHRRTAYGLIIKYHRPLWEMDFFDGELRLVNEAEANLELSNRAIRRRREGAEAERF